LIDSGASFASSGGSTVGLAGSLPFGGSGYPFMMANMWGNSFQNSTSGLLSPFGDGTSGYPTFVNSGINNPCATFESKTPISPPKFDGEDRLSLGDGWFLIKGDNGKGEHDFFLEFSDDPEIPASAISKTSYDIFNNSRAKSS
jgi:hypothetical protein